MKLSGLTLLKSSVLLGTFSLLGAFSANSAVVTPYSLGTLTPSVTSLLIGDVAGSFEDDIAFTIAAPNTNTGASASTFTVLSPFGGALADYSSFNAVIDDSASALVGTLTQSGNNYLFNGNLTPGNYTLKVTGDAIGSGFFGNSAGVYSVNMQALPVPEASTALSAIAGLGLMALVTRRRRFN